MRWGATVLTVALLIALVLVSGCANVSFGNVKASNFGSTPDQQKLIDCFIAKYGDPRTDPGGARFLEPIVTTNVVNDMPVDNVQSFSKDTAKIFFWVFYDNFAKGDMLDMKMVYLTNGKTVVTTQQQAGGEYGGASGSVEKPDAGWPVGKYSITVSGRGASGTVNFDIVDGFGISGQLPCNLTHSSAQRMPVNQSGSFQEFPEVPVQPGSPIVGPAQGSALCIGGKCPSSHNTNVGPIVGKPVSAADEAALIFAPVSCRYLLQWGSQGKNKGQFSYPMGIAVSRDGEYVYVADTFNQRIQRFDPKGNYLHTYGPTGWVGSGIGQYSDPRGIAGGYLDIMYVADAGNNRIQKFFSDRAYSENIVILGEQGTGKGQFNLPSGICSDSLKISAPRDIYIADTGNNRIQKFDALMQYITEWGEKGSGDGQFNQPMGIAVSEGYVFVSDTGNNRIQKFQSDGKYVTQWGIPGTAAGQFNSPSGIAIESSKIFVADSGNNRIQIFDLDGKYITEWGERGNGNGQFDAPRGIAADSSGNVYVVELGNHRVQKFECR